MPLGNRVCVHDGCTAYGGGDWVQAHEALPHRSCVCGWRGAACNFPWHRSARHKKERGQHRLVPEVTP